MWTPEELEAMRQADAEIEADFVLSHDEVVAARERDRAALGRHGPSAKRRAYYETHKEQIVAYKRAYYETHKEQIAASQRAYYEANKEQIAAYKRAYYETNKEQIADKRRAYYEARRQRKESEHADRILMDRG